MQFSEDEIFALIGRLYAENLKLHTILQAPESEKEEPEA